MHGLANSYAFWILVFVVPAVVFLLPTLIGLIRGVDRLALVFLVWLAALGEDYYAVVYRVTRKFSTISTPPWQTLTIGRKSPQPRPVRA